MHADLPGAPPEDPAHLTNRERRKRILDHHPKPLAAQRIE